MEKLELVGLADRADHTPSELSGGQQQRVTIARALANDPALVWADEPTGNLDSSNEDEIMELLRRLNLEQEQTFVIVTHSQHVGLLTDRTIQMFDGKITDHGHEEAIRQSEISSDFLNRAGGVVRRRAIDRT